MFNSSLCSVTYLASEGPEGLQSKLQECLQEANLDHFPYMTVALASLVVYLYIKASGFKHEDVWISPMTIFRDGEYHRLLTGVLYHADDTHLVYNLASFVTKCALLEQRFKPWYVLYMVIIFTVLSSLFCTFLRILSACINKNRKKGLVQGCIGISGVLFALKVVISDFTKENEFMYWLELAAVHIMTSEACFTSHLGGILVGVLYKYNILQRIMNFGSLDGYAMRDNEAVVGT